MTLDSGGGWPDGSTDSELLRRVRARDAGAWDRLVDWAGPMVLYWCRRAGLAAQDREDVFQDVFLTAWSRIESLRERRPGDSFRGWLLTVTRSRIVDLARRRLAQPRGAGGSEGYQQLLSLSEAQLSEGGSSAPDSKRRRVQRALEMVRGDFDERLWLAFWRTAVDGLNAAQAAAELGMTPAAVRKAKSRVLARLRQEFGGLLE